MIEQSARPEDTQLAADRAVVRDDGAAERAVNDRELAVADPVERKLVPGEDALGIGPRLAAERHAEHDIEIVEIVSVGGIDVVGVVERRDAVDDHSAPLDLIEADFGFARCTEESLKAPVDPTVQEALESFVLRMRLVSLTP